MSVSNNNTPYYISMGAPLIYHTLNKEIRTYINADNLNIFCYADEMTIYNEEPYDIVLIRKIYYPSNVYCLVMAKHVMTQREAMIQQELERIEKSVIDIITNPDPLPPWAGYMAT